MYDKCRSTYKTQTTNIVVLQWYSKEITRTFDRYSVMLLPILLLLNQSISGGIPAQ